ncbi:unnamed protein product, partial [marine sediment metagenome]
MDLKEIIEQHQKETKYYRDEITCTELEVKSLQDELETLRTSRPSWITLIKAIAEEIRQDPQMSEFTEHEVLGPFGLGAMVSIHFFKTPNVEGLKPLRDDNCKSITFTPKYGQQPWDLTAMIVNSAVDTGRYKQG